MKKLLFAVLVTIILSTFGGIIAYADSTTTGSDTTITPATTDSSGSSTTVTPTPAPIPTPTPVLTDTTGSGTTVTPPVTPVPTTGGTINKNDPLYLQLQTKYSTIKTLRTQESQVYTSIDAQNKANSALRTQIKGLVGGHQITQLNSQVNDLKNQNVGLREQKDGMQHSLADAYRSKDKNIIKSINTQISGINSQIKTNEASITQLRGQIKSLRGTGKDAVKQADTQIATINDQINYTIKASILDLQATKDQEWINFDQAILSANLVDANTHMDNILSDKQQIITQLNQSLTLKQQIQTILQGLVTSLSTTPTTPAPATTTTP